MRPPKCEVPDATWKTLSRTCRFVASMSFRRKSLMLRGSTRCWQRKSNYKLRIMRLKRMQEHTVEGTWILDSEWRQFVLEDIYVEHTLALPPVKLISYPDYF